VSQKTFPQFVEASSGQRTGRRGIAWALTSNRNYPPHLLIEALGTPASRSPRYSKSSLPEIAVRGTRAADCGLREEPNEKAVSSALIGEIADDHSVQELLGA